MGMFVYMQQPDRGKKTEIRITGFVEKGESRECPSLKEVTPKARTEWEHQQQAGILWAALALGRCFSEGSFLPPVINEWFTSSFEDLGGSAVW